MGSYDHERDPLVNSRVDQLEAGNLHVPTTTNNRALRWAAGSLLGASLLVASALQMSRQHTSATNSSLHSADVPLVGKPIGGHCTDLHGHVFNEMAVVASDPFPLFSSDLTLASLPSQDGGKTSKYFIHLNAMPDSLGGGVYLESGTLELVDPDATYSDTQHCHVLFRIPKTVGLEEEWGEGDTFANSWDGGKNWIMMGFQNYGDDQTTTPSAMMGITLSATHGKECKHRAAAMQEAFASVEGITVFADESMIHDLCRHG